MAALALAVLSTLWGSSMMTMGLQALTSSWGLRPPMSLSLGRWKMFTVPFFSSLASSLLKAPMLMIITWMAADVAKLPTGPMSLES